MSRSRSKPLIEKPEQEDLVQCHLCHKKLPVINNWHLKEHQITLAQYKQMFPDSKTCSQSYRYKVGCSTRGKKRPNFSKTISGEGNGMFGRKHASKSIENMRTNRKGKGKNVSGKYIRTSDIRRRISEGVIKANLSNEPRKTNFVIDVLKPRYHGKRGKYRSRCGRCYIFKSTWELSVMIYLDKHPEVMRWEYEPFWIPYLEFGRIRSYRPDFLIQFPGFSEVWEVKPQALVGHCENTWNKIYALEKDVIRQKFNFHQIVILSENEIFALRKTDWKKLYQDIGFSLDELEQIEKEMAENVKINDKYYRGEK
jgi:hypothetical protein